MKNIKIIKTPLIISFLFIAFFCYSQESDTTELKMGDKKILIIEEGEELEEGITDLRKGIIDFKVKIQNYEKKIEEQQDSIDLYNEQLKNAKTEEEKIQIQSKIDKSNAEIEDHLKKIEAFEKGIEQINTEIEELSEKLDDLASELETDLDDMDFDFNLDDLSKKKKKKFKGHWAGFEFGINNYFDNNLKMELPTGGEFMELNTNKSWGFGLNFLQYSIPLFSKYAGIVTGMGFEWNNYHFKQNIDLLEDSLGVIIPQYIDPNELKYTKNTLNTVYFNIPLIIEFQIPTGKKDNRIFCGIGGYGGIKVASKTKKVYERAGDSRDLKFKGDYQLSPFRYGLTARVGYEFLQVYMNYSLISLFEPHKGPELYPVSIGLRIDF
jgi:hypothetical protein